MELAERIAYMERTVAEHLGRPLTEREAELIRAVFVGVVVDSEVSREIAETPS